MTETEIIWIEERKQHEDWCTPCKRKGVMDSLDFDENNVSTPTFEDYP
jgi:hypothetical protein